LRGYYEDVLEIAAESSSEDVDFILVGEGGVAPTG